MKRFIMINYDLTMTPYKNYHQFLTAFKDVFNLHNFNLPL